MPHLSLPGGISLYYEVHHAGSTGGSSSSSSALSERPTVLLLSPSWLDASFLSSMIETLRDYNVVVMELRSHGRTRGEVSPNYDHFVGAADIAFAMEALHIPPSHVYGTGAIAFQVALKLCLLFPNQVLSLAMSGISGLFSEPMQKQALEELNQAWCFPEDEGDFYEAMDAMCMLFLSVNDRTVQLTDLIVGALVRRYSPYKLRRTFEVSIPNYRAPGVTRESLAAIKQPVLLMHGCADVAFPLSAIEEVKDSFTGAAEVDWRPIEGAPHMIGLTHPELVSDLFTAFLARHATTASTVVPLDLSYALHTVSALGNNPGILRRDPRQPESYSLLTPEEKAEAAQTLARYKVLEESCTLWLPGVNDKEEWEKDPSSTVRARQPWKFSTRNQTETQRPMSARKSLVESISVETQAARSVSESPLPPMPEMSNLNLDSSSSIPPPVPPKDPPATPTMNESCGTRGETWMGAGAGGARTRLH